VHYLIDGIQVIGPMERDLEHTPSALKQQSLVIAKLHRPPLARATAHALGLHCLRIHFGASRESIAPNLFRILPERIPVFSLSQ
jgi:hypothetical protein